MIDPEHWQPADGLILEPNALRAAKERERCLALTAGPGAGKTEMLAQRADFLLSTGVCRYPHRVLAISFKVDAAANLRDRVGKRAGRDLAARFDSYTFHAFAKRLIDRFRVVLVGNEALDFDYTIGDKRVARKQITFSDLVPLALQILKSCRIARNAVRATYTDVFLDEFQDCTRAQYELLLIAFGGTKIRLVAVGDTKQRIMGWAGALEGIFIDFARDFDVVALNLYRNFRSKPRLLRMQNEMIRDMDPSAAVPPGEIEGDGGEIQVWEVETSADEAERIVEQISQWLVDGTEPAEIAVLVSRQPQLYAARIFARLMEKGVPFRDEQQVQDLFVEPLTRLVLDYLLVLYGRKEPQAYHRLMSELSQLGVVDVDPTSRDRWLRHIDSERRKALEPEQAKLGFAGQWLVAVAFLKRLGKEKIAALSPEYAAVARLRQLIVELKQRLQDATTLQPDIVLAIRGMSADGAVRVMTIHKSKGLEFDRVVVLGVENETFWGEPDAERCAFFVGISRAKSELVLTYAATRERPDGHSGRWDTSRTPQTKYLGYAGPAANTIGQ